MTKKTKTKGGTINDDYEKSFYLKNIYTEEYLIILSDKRFVNKYKMKQDDSGNIYIHDSDNERNIVIYNIKDKTYSFKDTHHVESYFEEKGLDNIIRHKISNNNFILELIDENNAKQKHFEDMQNIREKLCDKMVEYVLNEKNKVNSNENYYNAITCPRPDGSNYEHLGEELCKFFDTLFIYTRYDKIRGNLYFLIRDIFLQEKNLNIVGGRLAYAIIQGIKMGIILLKAMDIEKKYIFGISSPLLAMKDYLKATEKLELLGRFGIYIEKCKDEKHFYWEYSTDEANSLPESKSRFEGNGKFPLIIAGKEPIFAPGSATANAIKDHIISLIIKNMNNIKDTPFDFLNDISDLLVQTVFDKFIITKVSRDLKIEFKYKQMFIRIDILNNVISGLMQEHYSILISNNINSINDKSLSNYRRFIENIKKFGNFFKKNIGGNKGKKEYKKDILGNLRCIYKIPGDRKEYVKHNGMLITVKNYKDIISSKKKIKKYKGNNI